jgi:protein tyrosine/serine phosphatase
MVDAHTQTKAAAATVRPVTWGVPVPLAGAPNLHRVTPVFYRSAQPLKAGFQVLQREAGIKTVVSLRAFHSDQKLAAGTGLTLISIPINTWNLKQADLVRALAEIEVAAKRGPVLLHCQHGADRTGLVTALHRMLNEGWTREAALDEMRNGQFGYHAVWGNIPNFLAKVDIDAMRREVAAEVCRITRSGDSYRSSRQPPDSCQ